MPSSTCRQLGIKLKKNYILKKRTCCSTLWEFLVPIFAFLILLLLRSVVKVDDKSATTNLGSQSSATDIYSYDGRQFRPMGFWMYQDIEYNLKCEFNDVDDHVIGLAVDVNSPSINAAEVAEFETNLHNAINGSATDTCVLAKPNNPIIKRFNSESAMVDYVEDTEYGNDADAHIPLYHSIVLLSTSPDWNYKIRSNFTMMPDTSEVTDALRVGYDFGDRFYLYENNAIISFQFAVETTIMGIVNATSSAIDRVYLAPFPINDYKQDLFATYLSDLFGIFMVIAFIWPFSRLVRNIVHEKETKIKAGLSMIGLKNSVFWASWLLTYFFIFLIIIIWGLIILSPVFKYSDSLLVFFYLFFFCTSLLTLAALVASFFSRAKTAGTMSTFILFVLFIPYFAVSDADISESSKNAACLLSPVAFSLGGTQILEYESAFLGMRSEFSDEERNNFRFSTAIVFMLVDTIIYGLLAWYCDKVVPQEHGGAPYKPWFCITKQYWCGVRDTIDTVSLLDAADEPGGYIEDVSAELKDKPGLRIKGLRKEFPPPAADMPPHVAVHNLELDMYEGQIFVLLGHNGAGKSTTINMLTGMLEPTSGTAEGYGLDFIANPGEMHNLLGVCPQHDVIWPTLTVKEHLVFFAGVRGIPSDQVEQAVVQAVTEVQLDNQLNQHAGTMSGGQKRRLSLAIALIGDPKIVFLDEPTSGVDPFSRRSIWDLLTAKKQDRVIILTTHFMDEADQLGDRIGILHHGKLKCCGSPLYLKSEFGVGYNITFAMEREGTSPRRIQNVIKTHVPEATALSQVGSELSFRLPLQSSRQFAPMLRALDAEKKEMGFENYGLSVTTLEEVFIRVAKDEVTTTMEMEENKKHVRKLSNMRMSSMESEGKDSRQESSLKHEVDTHLAASEPSSFMRHVKALLYKRWHVTKRDRKALFWQLLLPIVILAFGMGLMRIDPSQDYEAMIMSTGKYNQPLPVPMNNYFRDYPSETWYNLRQQENTLYANTFTSEFIQRTNGTSSTTLDDYSWAILANQETTQQSRYGAYFFEEDFKTVTIFTNNSGLHAMPTFLNAAHNALLDNNPTTSAQITVSYQPFPRTYSQKELVSSVNAVFSSLVVAIAFSFIPASYIVFIVSERETNSKHLQLISGVNTYAYWLSNFLWDYISFMISGWCCLFIILAFQDDAFTEGSRFGIIILDVLLYGLAVIPFTYCCSFFFKSHSTAQNVMILVYLFSGLILIIVSFALYVIESTRDVQKTLRHFLRLFPNFCLGDTFFFLTLTTATGWDAWDMNTSGFNLLYMAIESIIYFLITLGLEHNVFDCILDAIAADPQLADPDGFEDRDVQAEKERIRSGGATDELITLKGLRKTFANDKGGKIAVSDLWFSIPKNECFGFLGVNGAGKSTTLKMLTGDLKPTSGHALLGGKDILEQPIEVRRLMGYCPQFDALHALMTAVETLEFYGRIRGVPEDKLPSMIEYLSTVLTLTQDDQHLRPSGTYSGGNKRKLSVAIALIGSPPVVFLDEPSTGMDPVSRRFMWDFINQTMKDRAVILTTHSMEECEALCRRIGILVLGSLKCIGTSQHLKSRFGKGYQVEVQVKDGFVGSATNFVERTFEGVTLIESYGGALKFRFDEQKMDLADIFTLFEDNRDEQGINEYSIGQTSLEQIFIGFAKEGDEERLAQLNEEREYTRQSEMPGAVRRRTSQVAPAEAVSSITDVKISNLSIQE